MINFIPNKFTNNNYHDANTKLLKYNKLTFLNKYIVDMLSHFEVNNTLNSTKLYYTELY